jgi:glycosyltransferase involved in cell wall biosynthesis
VPVIRVLHVIDGLAGGGSERWVYDISRLSDPMRVRHRVTTVHPDRGRFVYADSLRRLGVYGTPRPMDSGPPSTEVVPRRSTRFADNGRFTKTLRLAWHGGVVFPTGGYRALREWISFRPAVIHAHTFHGFLFALQLARLARLPLVHTVPSLFAQMVDAGYGWLPRLYKSSHGRVARFFTAYPDELERVGVPASKIQEIHGVIDLPRVEAALADRSSYRSRIRTTLGIGAEDPIALSVGRLHHSKGHEPAAAAIALAGQRVRDLHWILLGEGDGRASLEARVRELRIDDRTHMIGFVTEVLPFYAAADLYLRTPLFEAENQASYQAMGMGLPVAGFDTGTATDLIRRVGHGLLVPSGDSTRLADAIVELLDADDRSRAVGGRGQAYARAKLGVDRTIEDFTSTYEDLASPQAGGA